MADVSGVKIGVFSEDKTKKGFDSAKKGVGGLTKTVKNYAAEILVSVLTVKKLMDVVGSLVSSVADAGDMFDKMSKRTALSTEFLSEFGFVAGLAGTSINALEPSFKRVSKALNDANNGLAESKRIFDQLDISIKNADGTLKATDTIIAETADRFTQMKDETQKMALAQELFGRGGLAMIPILNQGSDAIKAQMLEAKELGATWTTETTKAAADFVDSQLRLKTAWEGIKRQTILPLIQGLTPEFEKMAKETAKSADTTFRWVAGLKLGAFIVSGVLRTAFSGLTTSIKAIFISLDLLGESMLSFGKLAARAFNPANWFRNGMNPAQAFKAEMAKAFEEFSGMTSAAGQNFSDTMTDSMNNVFEAMRQVIDGLKSLGTDDDLPGDGDDDGDGDGGDDDPRVATYKNRLIAFKEMIAGMRTAQESIDEFRKQSLTEWADITNSVLGAVASNQDTFWQRTIRGIMSVVNILPAMIVKWAAYSAARLAQDRAVEASARSVAAATATATGLGLISLAIGGAMSLVSLFNSGDDFTKPNASETAGESASASSSRYSSVTRRNPQTFSISPQVIISSSNGVQVFGEEGVTGGALANIMREILTRDISNGAFALDDLVPEGAG